MPVYAGCEITPRALLLLAVRGLRSTIRETPAPRVRARERPARCAAADQALHGWQRGGASSWDFYAATSQLYSWEGSFVSFRNRRC